MVGLVGWLVSSQLGWLVSWRWRCTLSASPPGPFPPPPPQACGLQQREAIKYITLPPHTHPLPAGVWRGTEVAVKYIILPGNMSGKDKYAKMAVMEGAMSSSLARECGCVGAGKCDGGGHELQPGA